MKWCKKCVLPDTRPHLVIGEDGICNACKNHNLKSSINWDERYSSFLKIVNESKSRSKGYDCLIPVSGGKDSTWQTVKCLEMGLRPLAVTWRTPSRTEIGQKNLDNLISLGVDHIDYSISPIVEKKFMVKSFERFGSTAIPMHMALFNIPLLVAYKFNIPLIIWGENSAIEYGSSEEADKGFKLSLNWIKKYGVTHGTIAKDWIDNELSEKDLTPYFGPNDSELSQNDLRAIFLGYYIKWDPELTKKVAMDNGFKIDKKIRTGYYNYADIDDDFISIHHWMKWYKFGFTRLFDNLSLEIRNKRMTRENAINLIIDSKEMRPDEDIKSFCKFVGISELYFFKIAEKFRNHDIWKKKENGKWYIPNHLIHDWNW